MDTGAAASVCPITFCEQVPITPVADETRKQYVSVTGEGLTIQGWKETALIIGTLTMQCIGVPDLNDNKTTIHTGDSPYIAQFGHSEQLRHIGAHLHVASMVPGLHTPNEIQLDNTVTTRYSPISPTTLIVGDMRSSVSKPAMAQHTTTTATTTTTNKTRTRRAQDYTHMPYRSWCPICVKAKGQPTHHKKIALKEQSILQLDYAYIKSNNPKDRKVHTILTGVDTITGLCWAIPTMTKGLKEVCDGEWLRTIDHTLQCDYIQVDNEPAIIQLAQEAAQELAIPWSYSSPHVHQGQGAVERFQ
eukprot:1779508-Amphidinium_carterae.5